MELGAAPVEAAVAPGTHWIELSREGYRRTKTSVIVRAGERRDVDVNLDAQPGLLGRWWFWTAVGVAVAGGVVLAIAATTERDPREGTVPPGVVVSGAGDAATGFRF